MIFKRDDSITGSQFNDKLYGFGGADQIVGKGGRDTIVGGNGRDKFISGADADTLTGGGAGDTFIYRAFDESTAQARDVITRFSCNGGDKIDLRDILPNSKFTFIGEREFADYLKDNPGVNKMVRIDVDKELVEATNLGSGPDLSIRIVDMPGKFGANDFFL